MSHNKLKKKDYIEQHKDLIYLGGFILIFILSINISLGANVLNNSVYYASLDQNGTITDLSGYGSNATIYGATFANNTNCKLNGCYAFSSVTKQTINITQASTPLNNLGSGDYTLNLWIKRTNTLGTDFINKGLATGNNFQFATSGDTGKPYMYIRGSAITCQFYNVATTNQVPTNQYTMVTSIRRGTTLEYWENGVNTGNQTSCTTNSLSSTEVLAIGFTTSNVVGFNGTIDEVNLYNRSLNYTEIQELYNNNNSFNPYQQNVTIPSTTINYTITNNQIPTDINTSTTGKLYINTTITIQGSSLNNSNNVSIYYTSHTALGNGCSIYYQSKCIDNGIFKEKNMSKINNSLFTTSFDDDEYFPGYYPYNQTIISNSIHSNITIYNNNNLKFNIYNFSTNATDYFITIDFYAVNKTSSSGSLIIMYCNSSYTTGNPLTNINCVVVDAFLPTQLFSHFENKSYYLSAPISIRNVTKTQLSYFVFISGSNIANGWNFAYVNNSNYDNTSFNYGSFTTWANTSAIFDMHIHPLLANDYFKYYTTLTDNGTTTTSNTTYDFYNITNYAPSAPLLIQPCGENFTISNTINASVFYNWTPSIDINGDSFNYTLYYADTNNMYIPSTNTTITLIFSNPGVFSTYVKSCDIFGNCDTGNTCEFTICKSNYVKNFQPCINDARLINYSDSNLCSVFGYDLPSDNGLYENCTSTNTQALNNIALQIQYLVVVILIFILIYFVFKKNIVKYN